MSISIESFCSSEVYVLSEIGKKTFMESHGHCADPKDVQDYIDSHFNKSVLVKELENSDIRFRKILVENQLAGYSKLILNSSHTFNLTNPIAKFERLYLLKEFYGLGLGKKLLKHNIKIAKEHNQKGLWLFVWVENLRAFKFYQKNGFKVIGKHDFKISDNHSNPNYIMLREI
jgi:ribosomal protein S18 acetylase RimI-like enzyme